MLELFQTEWCPSSSRVRQRLTELGVDYVNRQVPVDRSVRLALRAATGADTIPVLRCEDGSVVVGEERILEFLTVRFAGDGDVEAHRSKADGMRRQRLAEECECAPQPDR
jgi:glutathione S-transferase